MTDQELDRMIDAALPAYVAEPVPGLAERVVARTSQRRFPWWPLAVAAAAAAFCAVAWRPIAPAKPVPPKVAVVVQAEKRTPVPVASKAVVPPKRTRPAARPIPASPQELRLAQFVAEYPELAQQAFSVEPERPVQPLSVPEPIEIQPLSNF